MEIIVLGLSHKTAPIELREKLHIPESELPEVLEELGGCGQILERMILSTCNRVEAYAVVDDVEGARRFLVECLAERHKLLPQAFESSLYLLTADQAIRHIFRVASSLDAMVVGESQILGQVKAAYAIAIEQDATGSILNALMDRALRVAKRVRTETGIATSAVSVSTAAIELAKKIFGALTGRTVMLIGAGKMSELSAKHLLADGVGTVIVANRNFDRAVELAERWGGRAVPYDHAKLEMVGADIIISSTGAPHQILSKADFQEIALQRRNRPIFVIDIAVPRDIDPAANEIDNVYLYDLDDLQGVVQANLRERQREADVAEGLIDREVRQFAEWLASLHVVPTIVAMRKKVESIREEELQKIFSKLQDLTPEERHAISLMTSSIVNKILHEPTTELKRQSALKEGHLYVDVLRRLFGIGDE
ncbi:glutamyl-tRNA reductase [Candidatus Methylomirabilis sp.]|uniref:Glutamyl-tRNA reductase n=1 Tax=Candidatus Methylomirabilis tolerans TaxID=3123416 RepID=A0AAJ1AH34_9BACT|nr:glutamyl-tRNA reductase [Candidatus Methylomirabilis sp.]